MFSSVPCSLIKSEIRLQMPDTPLVPQHLHLTVLLPLLSIHFLPFFNFFFVPNGLSPLLRWSHPHPSQFERAPRGPLAISGPGLFKPTVLNLKALICHQAAR